MISSELHFKVNETQESIQKLYSAIESERDSGEVGYYLLPDDKKMIQEIKDYSKDKSYKNIIIMGIGGSSLGTKAIDELLGHTKNRNDKNLIFMENVDPNEITKNLKGVKVEESFFIMISKSGSTIETTSSMKYLLNKFNISFDSEVFKNQFAFITDSNSPLDQFASKYGVKAFYIPKNVGGRFSVFTYVGLLPLCMLGYDIEALLEGAKKLKDSFFAKNENTLVKKAYFYAKNAEKLPINVLFSYSSSFKYFNDWYVQLWGESLGKVDVNKNHVGLTPIGVIGSIDQHSFLQLVIEGPRDKTMTFIKVDDFENSMIIPDISLPFLEKTDYINEQSFNTLINAQCDATMQSVIDQGVNVDYIELPKLDEKSVGYMVFYYELLTSLVGQLLNINTYDQPGVELGKVILKENFERDKCLS